MSATFINDMQSHFWAERFAHRFLAAPKQGRRAWLAQASYEQLSTLAAGLACIDPERWPFGDTLDSLRQRQEALVGR
jgi:hypothetical protein